MVKLFSVSEMISLEKEANQTGLTYPEMMENAGRGIAEFIESEYSRLSQKTVLAIVGSGNNGGDALVALDHLSKNDWVTYAYIVKKREPSDPLIVRAKKNLTQFSTHEEDKNYVKLTELLNNSTVLIDGVFGTGIKLPLKGDAAKVLDFIKKYIAEPGHKLHVVAVDCPSGVDCDTGEIADETIPAEVTVTMAGMKMGLIKFPAANICGEIKFASIGPINSLQSYIKNSKIVLTKELIKDFLPIRNNDSHKGTFGTSFIIAGSVNYTGAALLAGLAAYRIGTGLVTMAVPNQLHACLSGQLPEATWILLPDELGVISADGAMIARQNMNRATSLLIGPGFGLEETTKEFLRRFLTIKGDLQKNKIGFIRDENIHKQPVNIDLPTVVDADGLKLISKIENWPALLPPISILTPHPGEMSIITGRSIEDIEQDRIGIAIQYASKWGHIIVLKGAFTVIADPGERVAIVPIATSALAKAGTGDVLSGMIVGLLAQGLTPYEAACAGAWMHATAGLSAAKSIGNTASVIARDVLDAIPDVINELT